MTAKAQGVGPIDPHTARTPRWLVATAFAAAAVYLGMIWRTRFVFHGQSGFMLFDDAMISLRYAHNLARGFGLLWNPGEPPVEGISNFLWTLWLTLLHFVPVPLRLMPLLVSLSSAALLIGNLWLVLALVRRAGGHTPAAVVAVLFSAFKYGQVLWSLQGMEVGFATFLVDAGLLLTWRLLDAPSRRDSLALGGVLMALVLTRDDLVVPAAVLLGLLLWDRRTRASALIAGCAVGLAMAGHLAFRLAYYGEALPNTYYLKLTGVPLGLRWLRGSVSALRLVVIDLAVPALLLAFAPRPSRADGRRCVTLMLIIAAQLAYSTFVGGDSWETSGYANRFFAPSQSAIAILAGLGVEGFPRARRPWLCALAVGLALQLRLAVLAWTNVLPDSYRMPSLPTLHLWDFLLPTLACFALLASVLYVVRTGRGQAGVAALTVALFLGVTATEWAGYWDDGVVDFGHEDGAAILGLRLRELVPPTTRIAVTWAGSTPYFSDLPSVDLLGKNDKHIARLPTRGGFHPGHDKWDYAYSLGISRPDLILQLWALDAEDVMGIPALGYTRLPNGLFVREDFWRPDLEPLAHLKL